MGGSWKTNIPLNREKRIYCKGTFPNRFEAISLHAIAIHDSTLISYHTFWVSRPLSLCHINISPE